MTTHVAQRRLRDFVTLMFLPKAPCSAERLRPLSAAELAAMFDDSDLAQTWSEADARMQRACPIEDRKTGGVNPGDRRAIWYLTKGLGAHCVLEIGTHVGASTMHIADALRGNAQRDPSRRPRLVTVDITDVNSEASGPWKQFGLAASPRQTMQAIGCGDFVEFVTDNSVTFLDRCRERFDFIFLDGNHYATTVYRELPRALNLLNPGGAVLLHDYFPQNRPLWTNGSVVPGPFMAAARLRREGAGIDVLPLGDLPWRTKLGSNTTSLAVVARRAALN